MEKLGLLDDKHENGENGADENGDEKRHHRKHKKKSRHLERMVSFI